MSSPNCSDIKAVGRSEESGGSDDVDINNTSCNSDMKRRRINNAEVTPALGNESPLADRSLDDMTVNFLQRTVQERLVE